ncbi:MULTISPECIES: hypothetical protein [Serratia]|uniref:hypothetical protein n=1 Tax=Serratia TaxID=613 RepID=UPI0007453256|nr:hypothetical protein [Serratia marcescens]CAE7760253.1 hypothetical protein AI2795V1_1774 [Serratia marcescens]CAH3636461.1 hypothetical protein AI2795V1_1774 [Serratia marcescens]CUY85692.1 Uncharacterised protein [Serratia marcescens]CVD07998.1 Uncharacterised protein [Serratia marcescens]BEL65247.1 hypothetical protein SM10VA1_11350 [Serratia marcescens]
MARPRKNLEVPGQENQQPKENATGAVLLNSVVQQPANTPEQLNDATAGATVITAGDDKLAIVQQRVAKLLDGSALEERNTILSGLNERGAAVIARFEALEFLDADDHRLTDNLEFLTLVKKATDVTTGSAGPMVTNEEGKKQPAPGKPVLTEHGWHVPG